MYILIKIYTLGRKNCDEECDIKIETCENT